METVGHTNLPPRLPGPPITNLPDSDDPHPSLSDFHDYEPNLEFDDSELTQPCPAIELDDDAFLGDDFLESTDDIKTDLEADNYEDQLNLGEGQDAKIMEELKTNKFIDLIGADEYGQHIFAIYACNLPAKRTVHSGKIVEIIIEKMEEYVKNDYVLIYFHQGLKDESKPSIQFLWNAYKELDRSYKKNLKMLYVVHPTMFIKFVWNFFKPFISEKFKNKLVYVSSIEQLKPLIKVQTLKLPSPIIEFDEKANANKNSIVGLKLTKETTPTTAQFGVTLKFVIENSPCNNQIPPVVEKCISFLSEAERIETEGIFRRSGHLLKINELKKRINAGESVNFDNEDIYIVAGLLKSFFRELTEPLLTFELHDEIVRFLEWPKEERPRNVKLMLREKLPEENYAVFKYLIEFLVKVTDRKDFNKMTSSNLAIVFAPNLVWAKHNQMSLDEIGPINAFIDFVLQNHRDIYLVDIYQKETATD